MKTKNTSTDMTLVINQLTGINFATIMLIKKTNKYRIAKGTGISYRTLCKWQAGSSPSHESAILVGKFLGLVSPGTEEIEDIKKKQQELNERIERLTK